MSSTTKKIIIWIIVILFIITSGLTFILYFIPSNNENPENNNEEVDLNQYVDIENTQVVVPSEEIDINHPENSNAQVIVTEKENVTEMDKVIEVSMENGKIDNPTLGDFSDSLQLTEE